jgi:hypothetical protein
MEEATENTFSAAPSHLGVEITQSSAQAAPLLKCYYYC